MTGTSERPDVIDRPEWHDVCEVCDRERMEHRGSRDVPECPQPDNLTCPECITYWAHWTGPASRFAVAEIHDQHEPSRRARKDHAAWAKAHPLQGRRVAKFPADDRGEQA